MRPHPNLILVPTIAFVSSSTDTAMLRPRQSPCNYRVFEQAFKPRPEVSPSPAP